MALPVPRKGVEIILHYSGASDRPVGYLSELRDGLNEHKPHYYFSSRLYAGIPKPSRTVIDHSMKKTLGILRARPGILRDYLGEKKEEVELVADTPSIISVVDLSAPSDVRRKAAAITGNLLPIFRAADELLLKGKTDAALHKLEEAPKLQADFMQQIGQAMAKKVELLYGEISSLHRSEIKAGKKIKVYCFFHEGDSLVDLGSMLTKRGFELRKISEVPVASDYHPNRITTKMLEGTWDLSKPENKQLIAQYRLSSLVHGLLPKIPVSATALELASSALAYNFTLADFEEICSHMPDWKNHDAIRKLLTDKLGGKGVKWPRDRSELLGVIKKRFPLVNVNNL